MQSMVAGKRSQDKDGRNTSHIPRLYVWYDGSSKQSGGGQASISQRHLGSDVLMRKISEKKSMSVMGFQKKSGVSSIQVFLSRMF